MSAGVGAFEGERTRLLGLAYRLTGSVVDAEDVLQEAWIRYAAAEGIEHPAAWLTTVVSRLCLDRLGAASRRREVYPGTWLPEPIVTESHDPADLAVVADEVRYAALVLLDRLPADQRVAFVLHDVFDIPFSQIAETLGVTAANARQLASRGRRTMADVPRETTAAEHDAAVEKLLRALERGDPEGVAAALHPEVVAYGDSGGLTPTAGRPIAGPEQVARFFQGLVRLYGAERLVVMRLLKVNGRLGLVTPGTDGRFPARVAAFSVEDGRVIGTYDVAHPDKLRGVRLADWDPTAPGTPRRRRSPGR